MATVNFYLQKRAYQSSLHIGTMVRRGQEETLIVYVFCNRRRRDGTPNVERSTVSAAGRVGWVGLPEPRLQMSASRTNSQWLAGWPEGEQVPRVPCGWLEGFPESGEEYSRVRMTP
jgi:hypothetical protein